MKKIGKLLLVLMCVLCCFSFYRAGRNSHKDDIKVYSFNGSNEMFAVLNGTVFLSDTEETFCGGDLHVKSQELFSGVASYSTKFYILDGGEKSTVLSNTVVDMTGGAVNPDGDLGTISGDGLIIGNKVENIEILKNNLYIEICTVDANGKESTYQLRLEVTEVT